MSAMTPRKPDELRASVLRHEAMQGVRDEAMSWLQFGACFVLGIIGTVFFWLMVALIFTF